MAAPREIRVPITVEVSTAGPGGMDAEVAMIALAAEALGNLDPVAQARAARYLMGRFGGGA